MEMYIEQGESRMDCELKIASKYNRPFHILSQKDVRLGGFWGFFSKPGVQVEFYFPANRPRHYQNPDISSHKLEEEKKKVLAAARKNMDDISASGREASQQILDALKELKEKVESGSKSNQRFEEDHPSFLHVVDLLKSNDFSENYINGMTERLRKEMPLEQLDNLEVVQDRILEWIGESIEIFKEDAAARKPKVMVLIGPTGVGKTTTLSKLAAIYGIGTEEIQAVDVRMITIDAFRICAKEQLEQIGNIMQIPVSCVVNKQDLRKEIALHSDNTELFLIDTIGKSPKDASKLGEMKEILDGAPKNAE